MTKPNDLATGVYIAYPTTDVLKPIYRKLKTQVNNQHTKVGITTDSFRTRGNEYRRTFGGEIKFIPLIEVPADQLATVEAQLLGEIREIYQTVGRAREWFDTADRASIVAIVERVLGVKFESGI